MGSKEFPNTIRSSRARSINLTLKENLDWSAS